MTGLFPQLTIRDSKQLHASPFPTSNPGHYVIEGISKNDSGCKGTDANDSPLEISKGIHFDGQHSPFLDNELAPIAIDHAGCRGIPLVERAFTHSIEPW